MHPKLLLISVAFAAVLAIPASAEELSEVVRDREYAGLRHALETWQWTEADLSRALVAAAGHNRPAAARLLLSEGADPNLQLLGTSAIVTAVRENSAATLEVILSSGGDPNQRVMFEWAPLHNAILPDGVRLQALEMLIAHGAEIDARTNLQVTPLHKAAGFCNARAVEALLSAGADPALTEKFGQTAFQRSVEAGCAGVGGLQPTR